LIPLTNGMNNTMQIQLLIICYLIITTLTTKNFTKIYKLINGKEFCQRKILMRRNAKKGLAIIQICYLVEMKSSEIISLEVKFYPNKINNKIITAGSVIQ